MRVVVISGYFNPIHTGHIDYINAASDMGDKLVVIVNYDKQVSITGSTPFMEEVQSMSIVNSSKGVNKTVLSIDIDGAVTETLKLIYDEYSVDYFFDSMVFANGGDRTKGNSPEEEYCNWRGIRTAYNVGGKKTQSSSELLKREQDA